MAKRQDDEKNKNESDEEDPDESTPILKSFSSSRDLKPDRPSIDDDIGISTKASKVASALRKISQIGAMATSVNEQDNQAASGQIDDDSYSFEKTVLFGRYRSNEDEDQPTTFRRKSGMAVISPATNGSKEVYHVQDFNNKRYNGKLSSLRRIFDKKRKPAAKSTSKTNILDDVVFDDDEFYPSKKQTFCCYPAKLKRLVQLVLEDWIFLAVLGVIMALLSFGMDWAIDFLQEEHKELMDLISEKQMKGSSFARYFLWISYTMILVAGSALFAHYVAPQAIGSGIPEMKTILRGVILKEYLTFRTLISKVVGLTFSLGSGLPIGKEGPFVHVASVVANLLSHLVHSFNGAYANESRSSEMLAAGCAVGVACTFSAPVGGVLFSIEVTSVYFAVRNYWRGFFAATCAATVFRLLRVYTSEIVTVVAFYQTNFVRDSFLPSELPIFAFIGLICGILSAAFIYIQRNMVLFLRRNRFAKSVFQKYWLIYPILIALIVSSLTFPDGFGKYIGGEIRFSKAAQDFFQNCTFIETNENSSVYCNDNIRNHWTNGGTLSPFASLSAFLGVFYFLAAIASTVPIPSGIFGPSFVLGGGIGRLTGELVAYLWDREDIHIYPGVYAVVGAAAFCGGVTHTVSVAVIVFELTGQLVYILPVMIAVLIANAVCSYLQPSIYDSIIKIKHLPYLPDIPHSSSNFHGIRVEQFMTPNVQFLSRKSTNAELQDLLMNMPRLKAFPIVEDNNSGILIGSCSRNKLLRALNLQVGPEARQREANRRISRAIADIDRRFKTVDRQRTSFRERRPSIFDHLHPEKEADRERRTSAPSQMVDGINVVHSVDDYKTRSKSTSNQDPDQEAPGQRRQRNESSTASRFTVVPVDVAEPVPGLRPGGRRGALSIENLIDEDAALSAKDSTSTRKLSDESVASTLKPKHSTHSLFATMIGGLKRDRPKSVHGTTAETASHSSSHDMYHTIGGVFRTLTRMSLGRLRHKQPDEDYDLSGDERREWEVKQLSKPVNFEAIGVDPAPFQLVEHSSLFKVHSLFSLLGLNRAYVTKCGRLVGVVALRDLRLAIENVQAGLLFANSPSLYEQEQQRNSVGFEGAHLVGGGSTDEDEEEDIENDKLNPRLEVVSRVSSSKCTDAEESAILEAGHAKSSDPEKGNFLQVPAVAKHLSVSSDPCLMVQIDETKEDSKSRTRTFSVQPVFEISPSPSFTAPQSISEDATQSSAALTPETTQQSTSTLTPGDLPGENGNLTHSPSKKKPSRHVQICIPPTPDYKKNRNSFNFDDHA